MTIRMRILVIDDEGFIRTVLENTLRQEGCDVMLVSDGKAGIDALNTRSFDCVITDLKMPGADGRDVLPPSRMLAEIPIRCSDTADRLFQ